MVPLARPMLRLCVAMLAVTAVLGWAPAASAEDSSLRVTVRADNPLAPKLLLTNTGSAACQVVGESGTGTVALTRVEQGGKPIEAIPVDISFPEHVGYLLRNRLATLEPGASVEVELPVVKAGPTGQAIQSVVWSPSAGSFAVLFPIAAQGALTIDANYAVPILPGDGAPLCLASAGSEPEGAGAAGTEGTGWPIWALLAAGVLVVGGLGTVLLLIWRRRRAAARAGTAAVLVLAVGFAGQLSMQRPAEAEFNPDDDVAAEFAACMEILRANDDPDNPIIPTLDDPSVQIAIHRTDRLYNTYTGAISPTNIYIYWNPEDRHQYHGTGGNADPCDSLYHEFHHAWQHNQETSSREDCGGMELNEALATKFQNRLRARMGRPQRSHHGDVPLPSDDCRPAEPDRCTGPGCGDSNGDPHMRTFDGARYDFQAAGEFIAVLDPAGDLEIQVRQEPWQDSRLVAINSSVAMRIGADRVEVQMSSTGLALLVNGVTQPVASAPLTGGGSIESVPSQIVVSWPDGSRAWLQPIGRWGLRLGVEPAAERAGKLEGLLGDFNGNSNNDLRPRGGGQPLALPPTFAALYPAFSDSWRVEQSASLFTYAAGQSTDTFTDRTFPDHEITAADVPNRAAALALCMRMGVTDPDLLEDCVLDVALTGQPDFAASAAQSQAFTVAANWEGTHWTVKLGPSDVSELNFDGKAGEKVFVDVPSATVENSCGVLRLIGPGGKHVATGCIINSRGHIDGVVLPDTGSYTILIDPRDGAGGQLRVQLIRISDQQQEIVPDGAEVVAVTDRPGVVSRFTFAGAAGQKVFVHVPSSTLESQCGVLSLRGPNDERLTTGCIINGKGEVDGTVLPKTGTYTIVVDPSELHIGETRLKLIRAVDQKGTISINGDDVVAEIKQAGAAGYFTFTGTAGQRVFLDVIASNLPNQCGGLLLRGPDGRTVVTGCIINGTGALDSRGTELPASGTYTVVLDPNDAATGSATLRLRE